MEPTTSKTFAPPGNGLTLFARVRLAEEGSERKSEVEVVEWGVDGCCRGVGHHFSRRQMTLLGLLSSDIPESSGVASDKRALRKRLGPGVTVSANCLIND